MAKVLLDTNIALDYLSATRPRHADATLLLESLLESPAFEPCMLASSIKDAYFILCRHYRNEPLVRERLEAFSSIIDLVDLTADMARRSFDLDEPDYEDGLVRACAEDLGAAAIVTRDEHAFANSPIPALDARAFLSRFKDAL